jgi:hypothetical protein
MARARFRTSTITALSRFALFAATTALLLASFIVASEPARAQSIEAPRSQIVNLLSQRFAEEPAALGLAHDGSLVEVFTSPDGSTWTMVLTVPNGMSRIVVEGQAWIAIAPEADVAESSR